MSKKDNKEQTGGEETRIILGFNRDQRFRFYRWMAIAIVLFGGVWMFAYLQPQRWYKYTDVVSFEQVARDVEVGVCPVEKRGGRNRRGASRGYRL